MMNMRERKSFRILFTGVGRRVELVQAFREAALVLGKDLKIYGADLDLTAPALVFCDATRHTVGMREEGYIDNLLSICQEDGIDLIIPTIDTDLLVLSENKERFKKDVGTQVLISAPDKIRICRDKNLTSQFFIDCGLQAPLTMNNIDDWQKHGATYPAFIKPKDGSSSINAFKAIDENELRFFANKLGEYDYIIQTFISGQEYTIDIFCDWYGDPIYITPRKRLQVRSGEVLKTQISLDEVLIEESLKLCLSFKPCGPLAVQAIRDKAGVDYFIEINPRFGGGSPLSMKAGAKSAEAILRLLDGEKVTTQRNNREYIDNGVVYSRFDQSVWVSSQCPRPFDNNIRGVIFDLDDTLYSEKEYVKSGFKAVSDYLGDNNYENKLWHYFETDVPAIDALLNTLGRANEKQKVLEIYRSHKPNIHLYTGVAETLSALKKQGFKLGIITDGRPEGQRNKIKSLGLDKFFDADDIIITDELGGTQFRKPCDVAFRILLNRWKFSSGSVVYIGDNASKDFQAPKKLGMKCVWFRNKDGLCTELHTDATSIHTISTINKIVEIVPPPTRIKSDLIIFFLYRLLLFKTFSTRHTAGCRQHRRAA